MTLKVQIIDICDKLSLCLSGYLGHITLIESPSFACKNQKLNFTIPCITVLRYCGRFVHFKTQ